MDHNVALRLSTSTLKLVYRKLVVDGLNNDVHNAISLKADTST